MTLAIVTDSTSNISQAMADELGITIIPLNLTFGEETLLDMQDITPEAFFKRLTTDPNHPTTSQPSVGSFLEVYNKLIENGATEILSIHISNLTFLSLKDGKKTKIGYKFENNKKIRIEKKTGEIIRNV